ncbi:MAG: hypothetical protein FJW32_29345, partial [Acidobacteria bacterium]|nr:hypothetical protein [Acidobacteriota bacterium]
MIHSASLEIVPTMWAPDFQTYTPTDVEAIFATERAEKKQERSKDPARPIYGAGEVYWPTDFMNRPAEWSKLRLDNIAILDSGCDAAHSALKGRVDFADAESKSDPYGHGTFVAGCIVAKFAPAYEGEIANGILESSRVWMGNVFTKYAVINGMRKYHVDEERYWAYLQRLVDAKKAKKKSRLSRIQVLSLSLGSAEGSAKERRLIAEVIKSGITVVAAAGNCPIGYSSEPPVMYPAAYPDVISFGAMGVPRAGKPKRWSRSLRVPPPDCYREDVVDVYAPGECVL